MNVINSKCFQKGNKLVLIRYLVKKLFTNLLFRQRNKPVRKNAMTKKTMQAVQIHQYGSSEVLSLNTIDVPTVVGNDVLVKIHASAVNPVDWKIREGYLEGILKHELPLTLGWDVAGEIVAIGEQVSGWSIGDAIYSRPNLARNGTYAEYSAIDATEIATKPKSLSWQEAAAVPLAALTAWQALHETAQLKASDKVLIHAGAGGVGIFAIQLAKACGAHVITTCSARNVDFMKSLGADEVIDYQQQDFSEWRGIDVILDTMGGDIQAKSWQVLKKGGYLVSIVDTPSEERAKQYGVSSAFVFVQPNRKQLDQITKLIDTGKIKVYIDSVYSLATVREAQERSQSRRARGKIILQISE